MKWVVNLVVTFLTVFLVDLAFKHHSVYQFIVAFILATIANTIVAWYFGRRSKKEQ
jgi:uncharacterized membrane protein YvlD (DUF360 family)